QLRRLVSCLRVTFDQPALGRDLAGAGVERAVSRVIKIAVTSRRIMHAAGINRLKAFGRIVGRAVIEDRRHRVGIDAPVAPTVYAALRDDAARTLKAGDEMQRVNLMDHPLVWNARRIWPIQPEFDVLSRIESLLRAINHEAFPVRVFRTQGGDELRAAPAH